jgi:hypothetical protein
MAIFGRFNFLTPCHIPNTQLMRKVFIKMAATAPGGVLFQIHQVVPTFHIKNAKKENQSAHQNPTLLSLARSISLTLSSGTKAIKMNNVQPYGYHESHNRTPESKARKNLFLNSVILIIEVRSNIFLAY